MIVDKNGRSVTMVTHPGMSFITLEPSKEKDHLIMSAPGMDSITFTYPTKKLEEKFCRYSVLFLHKND